MIIKTIRQKSKIVVIMLCFTFSLGSFARNKEILDSAENYSKFSSFTGKDLFKGIMFYSGKAADLTEISVQQKKLMSNLDSKLQKDYSLIQEQILNVLEAQNPNYFNEFKKKFTSGNHNLVQSTVKSSSSDIRIIAAKLYNIDISGNTSADNLAKKMLTNSKYKKVQNTDGSINIEELNKLYIESNPGDNLNRVAPPEACLAIVLIVALVFVWVIEHNRAEVVTGNSFMLKSTFETENYVNQIVKSLK